MARNDAEEHHARDGALVVGDWARAVVAEATRARSKLRPDLRCASLIEPPSCCFVMTESTWREWIALVVFSFFRNSLPRHGRLIRFPDTNGFRQTSPLAMLRAL